MSKEWAEDQAKRIGAEVLRLRGKRSGQWLSDRTAELGYRVSRTTLSEIENGQRKWMSVAEVMVLARALNTAPITLLFGPDPLCDDSIEILPGFPGPRTVGLQWFSGEIAAPSALICDDPDEYRRNLKPVTDARRISELAEQKSALMRAFLAHGADRREKEAAKVAPLLAGIQQEIDKLTGAEIQQEIDQLTAADGG